MANLISDWRDAIVTVLEAAFPNAEIVSGDRSGVPARELIAVFFDGYQRQPGRAAVAEPKLVIRYWPVSHRLPGRTPRDPAELEQASVDLMLALEPVQATLAVDDLWYFMVDSVRPDYDPDEWGIEARLTGYAKNIAAVA